KTFTGRVAVSPSSNSANAVELSLGASSTALHMAHYHNSALVAIRVSRTYTTAINAGSSAMVMAIALPSNKEVVGQLYVVATQRSAGNVVRRQAFIYH